jgi:putative tryptophan/tyrosine transport system substrate-binding protein
VLFASGPAVVRYAHAASDTIPIVAMDLESDPVKDRLVASIAHPGGNLTGLFFDFPEFSAKWLQLLREAVPGLSRLAVLWDPNTGLAQLDTLTAEAKSEGLSIEILEVKAPEEMEAAFQSAAAKKAGSLLVLSSPLFGTTPKPVADLALKYRLPAITLFPEFAEVGGLMAYGTNLIDLFFQSGVLVGKVLDGAKPRDLPVERPSRFQLVINLRTAKALGLAIPTSLLLRADQIIE